MQKYAYKYVDQMRQTLHTLRQLAVETTSGEEQQELLHLFRDWQKHQLGGHSRGVLE